MLFPLILQRKERYTMTMRADCTKWCAACDQPERLPERPITVHRKISMCDACIADLVDARNAARLERHYRAEWMTHGREHLVLHRSTALDGRPTESFMRDCAGIIAGVATVGDLFDVYTWLHNQERTGAFDAAGIGSDRNPVTPELIAAFRRLPLIEWRVAETVPLRIDEGGRVVCATTRTPVEATERLLGNDLGRPVRCVRGLRSAILDRIELLRIYSSKKSRTGKKPRHCGADSAS